MSDHDHIIDLRLWAYDTLRDTPQLSAPAAPGSTSGALPDRRLRSQLESLASCGRHGLAGELPTGAVLATDSGSLIADPREAEQPAEGHHQRGDLHARVESMDGGRLHGVRDGHSRARGRDTRQRLTPRLSQCGSSPGGEGDPREPPVDAGVE